MKMQNGNETLIIDRQIWLWPDALYMLIPLLLTWALWFMLFIEHGLNLASAHDAAIRFQALFSRIIMLFPFVSTLAFIAACFPWSALWIGFVMSLIEEYCLVAFYAMLVGLGYILLPREALKDEMLKSFWTKGPFLRCGPEFKEKEETFWFFTCCVLQAAFFKPLFTLIPAIVASVNHGNIGAALQFSMRFLAGVSVILAITAVLRVYKFLSEAPGLPLHGHDVLLKFSVVKGLFLFAVVNTLFLEPMIAASVIPIDNWICSADALNQSFGPEFCQTRLLGVIFMCEVLILTVPACLSYRHHGLHKLDVKRKGQNLIRYLYYTFIGVFDLKEFILGDVVNSEDLANPEERSNLLAETVMEDEEETGKEV